MSNINISGKSRLTVDVKKKLSQQSEYPSFVKISYIVIIQFYNITIQFYNNTKQHYQQIIIDLQYKNTLHILDKIYEYA